MASNQSSTFEQIPALNNFSYVKHDTEAIPTLLKWTVTHFAPIFLVTSPVTSYAHQIWSMSQARSSAGFSLDVPLIMLVSSTIKIFYWFGARYNAALFIQAAITIFVQCGLLHVALLHRPLVGINPSFNKPHVGSEVDTPGTRPWNFWRWRSRRLYWHFLAYFIIVLTVLQIVFGPEDSYSSVQGYVALSVEAILPLPQIWQNSRRRSCRGFKFSVLVNWIAGDVFKMMYYLLLEGGVPWAFKLCGLFRVCCDFYLGFQYWMYAGYSPDTHR